MGDSKANTERDRQNNINHKSTQQLLQIIDTTLLKCYLQVSGNNMVGEELVYCLHAEEPNLRSW
jgi:hypothetical protein